MKNSKVWEHVRRHHIPILLNLFPAQHFNLLEFLTKRGPFCNLLLKSRETKVQFLGVQKSRVATVQLRSTRVDLANGVYE